jgi:hypothetical protein
MTASIRVASSPGEAQVAIVDGGKLVDYALWRLGAPDGVGDTYRGRVTALVPAMAGAFVALPAMQGFLPDSAGGKGLSAGTILPVQVTRAAQGSKGPRLTARLEELVRPGPVGLVRRGPDPVIRLAACYPGAPILVDDAGLAARLRLAAPYLTDRIAVAGEVFEEEIAEAIDALLRPVVDLPGGARMSIWPTPALVAIDLDAGGGLRSGAGGAGPSHEALNRAVLPALADQIRLRNLSGGIVVDVAGLSPRRRAGLAPNFAAALAKDPLRPKFLGFTALGLAEIVRSRVHPPLHELLSGFLATGLAVLRAVMAEYNSDPRTLPAVRVHPGVVSALQTDPEALPDLVRRVGRGVTLRSDPSLPETVWVLEKDYG